MKKKFFLSILFVLISINSFSAIGDSFSIRLHEAEGFYCPNEYGFKILTNSTVGLTYIYNMYNPVYDEQIPSSVQYKGKTYDVVEVCDFVDVGSQDVSGHCYNLTNFPNGIKRIGKKFGGRYNAIIQNRINSIFLPKISGFNLFANLMPSTSSFPP